MVGEKCFALVPVIDRQEATEAAPGYFTQLETSIDVSGEAVTNGNTVAEQQVCENGGIIEVSAEAIDTKASGRLEGMKPPKKWLQLDKYDETNMSFETFRAKLAICAEYNNWTERDQLAHLQTSLTHGAAQCLWDVGPEKVSSLSALLKILQLRFGSDNQRERYRTELRTRRQQP